MSEKTTKKIGDALELLSQANSAMIDAIIDAVAENEDGEISYSVTIDESCGYTEERIVSPNDDNEWCIFDENGNEIQHLEDATADELYEICVKISK